MWFHSLYTAQKDSTNRLGDQVQCAPFLLCPSFHPFFAYAQRKPFFFLICRKAPCKQVNYVNVAQPFIFQPPSSVPQPILSPLPVQLLKFSSIFLKESLINLNMSWLPFSMLANSICLSLDIQCYIFKYVFLLHGLHYKHCAFLYQCYVIVHSRCLRKGRRGRARACLICLGKLKHSFQFIDNGNICHYFSQKLLKK